MTTALIGINVLVTLKQPPNTVVQGVVANVIEQTATLVLQDGMYSTIPRASGPFSPATT